MKLLLSILFFSFFNLYSHAQTTAIPDTAFEAKLIQLGIDSDGLINGLILDSNAVGVHTLLLDSSNISSLTGIAVFGDLIHLNCSYNQLDSLDISTNTLLNNLNCDNNLLNNIDVSPLPNLRFLNCNFNNLDSIDVSNNPDLEQLRFVNNQLTNIDLSNNLNLTRLAFDYNLFTNIDLSNNLNLVHLSCVNNLLTNIDCSNNTLLTNVYCGDNLLTNINLSNSANLDHLSCFNNLLTNLNLSQNLSLSFLNCAFNLLTSLNLSNNPNLEHLSCVNNLLTNINLFNNSNLERLYCDNNLLTNLELFNAPLLTNLYCNYNYLNYINVKNNPSILNFESRNNLANLIICVNDTTSANTNPLWSKDSTASYTEICPNNTLTGDIKSDLNNNCKTDSLEPIVQSAIVQIISTTDTIYTTPNSSGTYIAQLDSGAYNISITSPYTYLTPCDSIWSKSVSIDSTNDLDTVNWALQADVYCPLLYASISAPFLRISGYSSKYTVSYCNHGTDAAYGAYIEVEIDSFLNVDSTELPIMSQVGNLYTFNLDTLDIGECGAFDIYVTIDTSAQIGQVHCSEVHIYPDSVCNNSWHGPIVEVDGTCLNDTIVFTLRNIGNPMINPRNYVVIEDNLVMFTNPFSLGAGANITIKVVAQPGKSYRMQAEQASGFPPALGSSIAYTNIQNCNGNSTNLNSILQYYNGNTARSIDTDCQANILASSSNKSNQQITDLSNYKTAQQTGYGSQHYIGQGTPLDYNVRFQNTSNDTTSSISHVTIFDTISTHLDLSTLEMKAASHDYTWQIINERTLRVDFPNTQLVHSSVSELLSSGFFRYEIQQKANLPLETVINNQAAIYFDYNPPIFTNTTLHTIGENYIQVLSMEEVWGEEMQVHLYPNPTSGLVYIEQLLSEEIQIKVFDNLGRMVLQENSTNKKSTIDLNTLPQGIYYINIQQGEKLSTHKLVKY